MENLLKIYSPTGRESSLSLYLKKELESRGFHVERDELGNVKAEAGSGKPHILLCGHMDTVPGRIKVRYRDGKMYGRGAVDAKGPLAAMIMAATQVMRDRLCKVTLAAVVDEEGEGKGVRSLIERKNLKPDYVVFGEPSGVDGVIIGYKGSLTLKLLCRTKTGHSAAPWLYKNAVEEAYRAWELIKNMRFEGEVEGSHFYSVTKCLTRVKGGGDYSVVPNKCELKVDLRLPPKISPEEVFVKIKEKIKERWEPGDIKFHVSFEGGVKAYEASKDTPLVNSFSIAIRRVLDRQPVLLKKTGTSDMNLMAEAYKAPMIAYGPGNSKLDHSPEEYVEVQEYERSIEVYREALRLLKTLHERVSPQP
ncbi:MAG: M20/M25/M40 family metallo-hydrolase [Candidatus Bathyarchaeia archaeon]